MKAQPGLFALLFAASLMAVSCGNDNDDHVAYVNSQIYAMMQEVYLWNNHLPSNVDPDAYETPAAYMEALRYDQYDKWSTVLTEEDFNAYFEEGTMVGYGFTVIADYSGNIWIAFVYRNTSAASNGVKRSWMISKIDGQSVSTNNFGSLIGEPAIGASADFVFINEMGSEVNLTLTMAELSLTPVLHSEVIEQGNSTVGYLVFQDFIETAPVEIDEVFNAFSDSGITELIIDLRYNGGGSVSVAEHIAGWILGKNFANQPFLYYEHNEILSDMMDTMYTVPAKASGFDLSRVFFIGTTNTASASELIITGVEPFIPSILAGSPTHGKPVGMYAIPIKDYVTLPVCFKYSNGEHEGDFYSGIQPTLPAADDFTRNFGDPDEASLKVILDYIETNTVSPLTSLSHTYSSVLLAPKGPLNQYLKAY